MTVEQIRDCCVIPEAIEIRPVECRSDLGAFSTRFIRAGEVLIRNIPTAHTLFREHRRERCSRCFSTKTDSNSLLRCGRCRQVWYCNRECQKHDYPFHMVECREAPILLSSDGSSNSALLVRNFLALRHKRDKIKNKNCRQHRYVHCGLDHFEKLMMYSDGPLVSEEMADIQRATQALWNQRKAINKIRSDSEKSAGAAFGTRSEL